MINYAIALMVSLPFIIYITTRVSAWPARPAGPSCPKAK